MPAKSRRYCLHLCCFILLALVHCASAAFNFTPGHRYTSNYSRTITQYNSTGTVVGSLTVPDPGDEIHGLTFGPDNLLYATAARDSGFAVLAIDGTGTIQATYPMASVYVRGNLSYGKLAVNGQQIFVAGANQITRFDIGNPNSGVSIYTNNQLFDVKLLPNGNLLAASAYEVNEITTSGAFVREIVLQGGERFVDVRGIEFDPATNNLFVSHLGYTDFYFQLMRVDATTGVLEESITHHYADDLFLTPTGDLLVGSRTEEPRLFTQELDQIGALGTAEQMFVTQYTQAPKPLGGTFTVTPASPVKPTTNLTATFAGWAGAPLPFTYSVREGSTVIVPPGSSASPIFTLPAGTHLVYGRVTSSSGGFADTAPVTIVVDGAPPVIAAPAGGFTPLTLFEGSVLPNYAAQAVVTDPSGVASVVQQPAPGSLVPLLLNSVTITATDAAGNSANFQVAITVFSSEPSATFLAFKGGSVPSAGTDPRVQTGAAWAGFGTPAINDAGQIAYVGKWKAPPIYGPNSLPSQSGTGVFVDGELVVKVGESVPGVAGAVFRTFKDPVIDDGGHVAFLATIGGTGVSSVSDSVVVSNGRTGALEILAREGSPAEGTGGATFRAFSSVAIKGDSIGGTLFTASLLRDSGSPAVTSATDTGAWWQPAGNASVIKLVRDGDTLGSETIKSFLVLKALGSSPGQGRGLSAAGEALVQLTLTGGAASRQAVALAQPGVLTELAGTGDSFGPALPTASWSRINLPSSDRSGANLSVLGTLTGVPSAMAKGIFLSADHGAAWRPLARTGTAAPGLGAGAMFYSLMDPVNSSTDASVAFLGHAKGGLITSTDNNAIWWQPAGGSLQLVAREGALPPGAPAGAKWKSFASLALPGGNTGPLFTATLLRDVGSITSVDDLGLYAVNSLGQLQELLRENQPLLGKIVKSFHVLKSIAGSPGVSRSFNAHGEVAALVTFTDGTPAIVKIAIP